MGHVPFGFSGRINRATWWVTVLVPPFAGSLLLRLTVPDPNSNLGVIVVAVLWIVMLWVWFAAGAKRLHDLNRTGVWSALLVGGPFLLVGIFILFAYAARTAIMAGLTPSEVELMRNGVTAILGLIWLALAIWAFIWFGCLRGTVGPNQYGPDPLEGKPLEDRDYARIR